MADRWEVQGITIRCRPSNQLSSKNMGNVGNTNQNVSVDKLAMFSASEVSAHTHVKAITETIGSASSMAANAVLRLLSAFTATMMSAEMRTLMA